MNTKRLRLLIDISMTILSIILMGGAYLFPADIVHEILGVALFVLWVVHITLNRRWYGALFRGKYNARRILQTVINCGILVCVIFLMISGIILSNHIFTFLGIESGLGFARIAHLLASHWYFVFMSLHIGLHVEMIAGKVKVPHEGFSSIIICVIFILISIYGLYAFIVRGIWRYLILRQQFFFFDFERGYILFALDYISIIILLATVIHYLNKLFKNGAEKKMEKIIAACGNDCSACPRYNKHPYEKTEEELKHTAELWMKIGYRDHVVTNEEISCSGCKPENWCRYRVVKCCEEKGIKTCGECKDYPCANMKECFEVTKSFEPMCRQVCSDEEYDQLKKAFFEKEKNLRDIWK